MTESSLPQNVYRLAQKEFAAIPGSPWVYWIDENLRSSFRKFSTLGEHAQVKQGLATADNERFLRFWWEVGALQIFFDATNREHAKKLPYRWFPCMKGGTFQRWYGNNDYVVNWQRDGKEMRAFSGAVIRNPDFYFQEGLTWSLISSSSPAFRLIPPGWIITHKGPGIYPGPHKSVLESLTILNSSAMEVLLSIISPTLGFEVGQLNLLPWTQNGHVSEDKPANCVWISLLQATYDETTFDFNIPVSWETGLKDLDHSQSRLQQLESQIDDEVFALYGISPADRAAIEAELTGGVLSEEEESDEGQKTEDEDETPQGMSREELAVRWISYAAGVVLGRFQPGVAGVLGSAIYRRSDFAIGSLPAPDEKEFDELVGSAESFAYIDEQGGRHVFSAQVEQALRTLAISDGIAVLDDGHPRDLARLVEQALVLMLGEQGAEEVIQTIDQGRKTNDARPSSIVLRQFLEKDFFTAWHFKWYRKRPVYWPIQSSKRSYGFVIFHEKITRETFYAIQREPYLDTKRNAVALKIADVQQALGHATGVQRKKLEKQLDELQKLADELAAFAKDLEAITLGGYEPEENWIDDGVILRMAPLWKVVPIWKSEPKKYWERLENGDFDWSHIAMKYWPDRVKEKCKTNKSFAIAHGVEG